MYVCVLCKHATFLCESIVIAFVVAIAAWDSLHNNFQRISWRSIDVSRTLAATFRCNRWKSTIRNRKILSTVLRDRAQCGQQSSMGFIIFICRASSPLSSSLRMKHKTTNNANIYYKGWVWSIRNENKLKLNQQYGCCSIQFYAFLSTHSHTRRLFNAQLIYSSYQTTTYNSSNSTTIATNKQWWTTAKTAAATISFSLYKFSYSIKIQ